MNDATYADEVGLESCYSLQVFGCCCFNGFVKGEVRCWEFPLALVRGGCSSLKEDVCVVGQKKFDLGADRVRV